MAKSDQWQLQILAPTSAEGPQKGLAGSFGSHDLFGLSGVAREVPSERDQAWLIDGDRPAVLKISNAAESPDQLDLEALAAQRVALVDPALPVALPWRVPGSNDDPDDPRAYRAPVERDDGMFGMEQFEQDELPKPTRWDFA